ncbi:hypothetical protein [Deinococcus aquaticus]|uniref:hypothetical protein n=1 Tax=Deinococcus aquaticus TaxID=328692 RepID=UPI0036094F7A
MSRAATWSLLLGGLLPAAHAAAPADCATLRLDTAGYMTYRSVEAFPNPTQTFSQELYNLTRPFAREVCGVKVTGDQTGYAFQAAQLKTLVDRLGSGLSWPLTVVGVGQSGGKPGYVEAAKIRISLPEGLMNTDVQVTGSFTGRFLPPDAVMAIRVDGGHCVPCCSRERSGPYGSPGEGEAGTLRQVEPAGAVGADGAGPESEPDVVHPESRVPGPVWVTHRRPKRLTRQPFRPILIWGCCGAVPVFI